MHVAPLLLELQHQGALSAGRCLNAPERYLHRVGDAGTRFWSGIHGLNEELGRHRRREGKSECVLCGAECESVVHVLWECSAYRIIFVEKLQELSEDRYADFDKLNSIEKTTYVLRSELWEHDFDDLLSFSVDVWEARNVVGQCYSHCYLCVNHLYAYMHLNLKSDLHLL